MTRRPVYILSGLDLIIPPFQGGSVIRLSLGRHLVNLLPLQHAVVAQRTNHININLEHCYQAHKDKYIGFREAFFAEY